MQTLVQFIIPLYCLIAIVKNLRNLWRPEKRLEADLKKARAESNKAAPDEPQSDSTTNLSDSETGRRLRSIRVRSAVGLAVGFLALWASGFEIGWGWSMSSEWRGEASPRLERLIRKHCAPLRNESGGSSLAVAVITGEEEALLVFGRGSFTGRAATGRTVYEIGSITKAFTGIALARDVESGAVRLNQPVQELLPPSVKMAEPARTQVTLRHLTTHTSGFPRLPANATSLLDLPIMLFGGNPYARYTENAFFEALRDLKLEAAPGARMEYSNFGTSLLGYALSRRAGKDYGSYIGDSVLQPLGMTTTSVTRPPSPGYRAVIPIGPMVVALRSWPWLLADHLAGAGALRSTPEDMLTFLRANLAPAGTPIGAAMRASHAEIHRATAGLSVGMNWLRSKNPRIGKTVIWHNGGTGGFSSFIGFTEDGTAGVMVLSNRASPVDPLALSLLNEVAR